MSGRARQQPWDQRIARRIAQALARTPVTPNLVTAFSMALCLAGAALFADGGRVAACWGAVLFAAGRFLDHCDGELARITGRRSRFGYYFDYAAGGIGYAALFVGLALGAHRGWLDAWALALGAAGAGAALISLFLNIGIDRTGGAGADGDAVGYPAFAGFELEDGIYLIVPIAWAGLVEPFFAAAGLGATVYCAWTFRRLMRLRRRPG